VQTTEILPPDQAGIARAAEILREGRLVAFPTETVYGLGTDACDGRAVAAVYDAKGRPAFNPLIVHVADLAAAELLVRFNKAARKLAEAIWPGPLTMVLRKRADSGVSDLVSAGLRTLAVRVPAHPLARALLAEFGGPLAAPSANVSGTVSPTAAAHVMESLGGRIAAVLDGGTCEVGLESTIIGFSGGHPVLLRPGGLAPEAAEEILGEELRPREIAVPADPPGEVDGTPANGQVSAQVSAPGQLASHYAPGARLRLNAHRPNPGEAWLGFGLDPEGVAGAALNLSEEGNVVEAAANLFAHLRALDSMLGGRGVIAVAHVPEYGLGVAINDRLSRAAAER
jgi:L-threonylcarbamoyladenylate synthase